MFRILWDPSSGNIKRASLKLLVMFCVRSRCLAAWNFDCNMKRNVKFVRYGIVQYTVQIWQYNIPYKFDTSNFSEARLILPEDGSQRIRNVLEFLIVF